jgi:Fur family ferric uptake transcriptional regulator
MAEPAKTPDVRGAERVFRDYLRARKLKCTPERKIVLRAVMANHRHFDAEQLLIDLRSRGHRVAKATIYRTLPLLVESGIIREVQFGDKGSRYEHTFGHTPHDHMVCVNCGRIIEFDSSEVGRLAAELAGTERFDVQFHLFQIVGRCPRCAKRRRKS